MAGVKPHDSYGGGEVRYHDVDVGFATQRRMRCLIMARVVISIAMPDALSIGSRVLISELWHHDS